MINSIKFARKRIAALEATLRSAGEQILKLREERKLLAMLASPKPEHFDTPGAMKARELRDDLLAGRRM